MANDTSEEPVIKYRFVGDGSKVISDAPSEDITEPMWEALPKHIQKSIAHSKLYREVKPKVAKDEPDEKPAARAESAKPAERAGQEPVKPAARAEARAEKGRE